MIPSSRETSTGRVWCRTMCSRTAAPAERSSNTSWGLASSRRAGWSGRKIGVGFGSTMEASVAHSAGFTARSPGDAGALARERHRDPAARILRGPGKGVEALPFGWVRGRIRRDRQVTDRQTVWPTSPRHRGAEYPARVIVIRRATSRRDGPCRRARYTRQDAGGDQHESRGGRSRHRVGELGRIVVEARITPGRS